MSNMEDKRRLFFELSGTYRPYVANMDLLLSEYNLYSSQWRIMVYLKNYGPHTISEIAGYNSVEKPTITRLVMKLIDMGFLKSTPGEDRRVRIIDITEEGHRVYEKVRDKTDIFYKYALEEIKSKEIDELTELMQKISRRIKEYKGR